MKPGYVTLWQKITRIAGYCQDVNPETVEWVSPGAEGLGDGRGASDVSSNDVLHRPYSSLPWSIWSMTDAETPSVETLHQNHWFDWRCCLHLSSTVDGDGWCSIQSTVSWIMPLIVSLCCCFGSTITKHGFKVLPFKNASNCLVLPFKMDWFYYLVLPFKMLHGAVLIEGNHLRTPMDLKDPS